MQLVRDYTRDCYSDMTRSDPYENERVRSYDRLLHRTLSKFLRESCLSSGQTKSMIMPILEQEPLIRGRFSKEELEKLSLLWISILGCFQDTAELLVCSGANVNESLGLLVEKEPLQLGKDSTVLHALLQLYPSSWCYRFVALVIDHGADLRAQESKSSCNQNVLHLALRQGRVQMSKIFLEKGANVRDEIRGRCALLAAAMSSKVGELLPLLMTHGADVFAKNRDRWNMLHHLAHAPDDVKHAADLARLLVDQGVSLDDRTRRFREYPIHVAVRSGGNKLLIKAYLEKGANVNVADLHGSTPLLLAASSSRVDELLPLLLQYGADVFATHDGGLNALHRLADAPGEHVEMARLLIEKGIPLYGSYYDDRDQPIHVAAENGKTELINFYLDQGADVNALAEVGSFPLSIAAERNHPETLKTLLVRGANVHLKSDFDGDDDGRNALHEVCNEHRYHERIVRLLLAAGANVLAEDHRGRSALLLAAHRICMWNCTLAVEQIMRELAVKKDFLLPSGVQPTKEKVWIMQYYPRVWNYYEDCNVYVSWMKFTRLIKNCTFFDLLTKSHIRIAELMRNPNLEANFGLYDLSKFSMYADDIRRAFERAQCHFNSMMEVEDAINEGIDYRLPSLNVRQVLGYVCNDANSLCCLDAIDR